MSLASKLNEKATPISNNFLPSGNLQSMFMEDCTGFEVNKIVSEMQNGKSSDVPISVIKKTYNIISPILAHHFNYLMGTGKFPDMIKLGKITHIFNQEYEQLLKNLSPSVNITNLW